MVSLRRVEKQRVRGDGLAVTGRPGRRVFPGRAGGRGATLSLFCLSAVVSSVRSPVAVDERSFSSSSCGAPFGVDRRLSSACVANSDAYLGSRIIDNRTSPVVVLGRAGGVDLLLVKFTRGALTVDTVISYFGSTRSPAARRWWWPARRECRRYCVCSRVFTWCAAQRANWVWRDRGRVRAARWLFYRHPYDGRREGVRGGIVVRHRTRSAARNTGRLSPAAVLPFGFLDGGFHRGPAISSRAHTLRVRWPGDRWRTMRYRVLFVRGVIVLGVIFYLRRVHGFIGFNRVKLIKTPTTARGY